MLRIDEKTLSLTMNSCPGILRTLPLVLHLDTLPYKSYLSRLDGEVVRVNMDNELAS